MVQRQRLAERFIPAGAGNTRASVRNRSPGGGSSPRARGTPQYPAVRHCIGTVHPRGRGEHTRAYFLSTSFGGSSPRARGTHWCNVPCRVVGRFIPAGAGNTYGVHWPQTMYAVHPRGRGEHTSGRFSPVRDAGSSPRARGTPPMFSTPKPRKRFIPAGAGNTATLCTGAAAAAVHPRGRGEHDSESETDQPTTGSSPRARGTPTRCGRPSRRSRFIPAGAGNTPRTPPKNSSAPVHPRGRGEHRLPVGTLIKTTGSSPRARGTPGCNRFRRHLPRFIPAGAGNTATPPATRAAPSVHPRGRGEHP